MPSSMTFAQAMTIIGGMWLFFTPVVIARCWKLIRTPGISENDGTEAAIFGFSAIASWGILLIAVVA